MSVTVNEIRKGFYLDSVALMRMSREIAAMAGVEEAAMMMGTPANREIMADAGLLAESGAAAGGGDLVIAVRASDDGAASAALDAARAVLDAPTSRGGATEEWQPRTLRSALTALPDATLALISVPGDFAAAEARKAIRRGLDAMIFSDNVSIEEEAELKREAQALGRLVMGPDCGTAIIAGTPLAFANVVPRGPIGVVGASGTGTQEITCLIAQMGGGISHAIGTGGRDLKAQVGGITALMALDLLAQDAGTASIVLVAKPPAPAVATAVLAKLGATGKPAVVCFMGAEAMEMPPGVTQVFTLKDAALVAMGQTPDPAVAADKPGELLGLFAGGTLAAEAQVILMAAGEAVRSNAPVGKAGGVEGTGHLMLDLGEDEYTRGRPHPMIDPTVRDEALIDALGRTDLSAVLLDCVIGYGAHADPAGHLADVVAAHRRPGGPRLIASVTGTEGDMQLRSVQMAKLAAAGIEVAPSNADAVRMALR